MPFTPLGQPLTGARVQPATTYISNVLGLTERLLDIETKVKGTIASRATDLTIATSTTTPITWESADIDQLEAWNGGTGIVVPTPGWYFLSCTLSLGNSTTGNRILVIRRGSTFVGRSANSQNTSNTWSIEAQAMTYADAGEIITAAIFQSSGGNLDILGTNTAGAVANLTVVKLS